MLLFISLFSESVVDAFAFTNQQPLSLMEVGGKTSSFSLGNHFCLCCGCGWLHGLGGGWHVTLERSVISLATVMILEMFL